MQSIVSTGKNINNAIHTGLEILGVSKQEVNIEILRHESKGFFGINAKNAVVKLTKIADDLKNVKRKAGATLAAMEELATAVAEEELVPPPPVTDEKIAVRANREELLGEQANIVGMAWVSDGQIYYRSSENQFPLITVDGCLELFKNGRPVEEKTTIARQGDYFMMKLDTAEEESTWQMTMDERKLHVFLRVEPGWRKTYTVPDVEPAKHITLSTEEKKVPVNTLTYEKIISELGTMGVIHGFNQAEIVSAMQAKKAGTYEIAAGIKPKPGRHGWVERTVDVDIKNGLKEKADGSVDFREMKTIPAVEKGKIFAVVHPPVPGECGYTVTNEPLPAEQTFPVQLKLGRGTMLVDDKIVATESGRPHIEKRGQTVHVAIMPKLTLPGNVDLSTGNIRFLGDIEVAGNVEEGMTVESDKDIFVRNTVSKAMLIAKGSLSIGGTVISSAVSVGSSNIIEAELTQQLDVLQKNMDQITAVIRQLIYSPTYKEMAFTGAGIQPFLRILIEKKFQHFPPTAKRFMDMVKHTGDRLPDDEWTRIAAAMSQIFFTLAKEAISIGQMESLSHTMKKLLGAKQPAVSSESIMLVSNALNSNLYCSGDITITGKGCVNTKIYSGGVLTIKGTVRGGKVFGRLGVNVQKAGAEMGTATVIAVPDDQTIRMDTVLEGTTIKIGQMKHTFKETHFHLTASLNKERALCLTKND
ncbi:hypothetical protein SAMN05421736_101719 [Evansella caseinilytica]|uniref:RNA-binding protein KhpB N-terminal domain-containing protein n=1 Tax=Evansella caseinilytica TaxID=1503961 RepID=A0A1H3I748_9BACI|nr:flagellar assembly protein A [Evansella caseinilytica]SDY22754.1 hypothetical protein SAMN05421736_101719 [Evansella caseinilytica]